MPSNRPTRPDRDRLLTIAIGRNTPDGTPLPDHDWRRFKEEVECSLFIPTDDDDNATRPTIVFRGDSTYAQGSDGGNADRPEDSYVIIAVLPPEHAEPPNYLQRVRTLLSADAIAYRQGSIAFIYDHEHEPVFNTRNGDRPDPTTTTTTNRTRPTHGGYPGTTTTRSDDDTC